MLTTGVYAAWPRAEVWGVVAESASALATAIAAVVAVAVYRHEAQLRRDAQARKIRAKVNDIYDIEHFKVDVDNYSDAKIIDPLIRFEKLDWDEVKLSQMTYDLSATVLQASIEEARTLWKKTPSSSIGYRDPKVKEVGPNKSQCIDVGTRPNRFQVVCLEFQDANGGYWSLHNLLADDGPKLVRMELDTHQSRWERFKRWLNGLGRTPHDKTILRQIDAIVANVDMRIDAENAEAARAFREQTVEHGLETAKPEKSDPTADDQLK